MLSHKYEGCSEDQCLQSMQYNQGRSLQKQEMIAASLRYPGRYELARPAKTHPELV